MSGSEECEIGDNDEYEKGEMDELACRTLERRGCPHGRLPHLAHFPPLSCLLLASLRPCGQLEYFF